MTWEIFLGIVAIIGFIASVTGPMIKLNTSITKLNDSVGVLQSAIDRIENDNKESHKRLWDHNNEQDEVIANHTRRLDNIEHTMDVTERLHPELTGLRQSLSRTE